MVLSRSNHKSDNVIVQKLQSEITEKQHSIVTLKRRKQFLDLLKNRLHTISDQRVKELSELGEQLKIEINHLEKIKRDLDLLRAEENNKNQNYAIIVHNKLYRKVIFTIGYKQYINEAARNGVSVQKKGDELEVSPLA